MNAGTAPSWWADLQYFQRREFVCPCGCGRADMQQDFVEKLDDLRGRLGFPLVVTSGFRCPEYNAQISTTGRDGPHTTGRAADLAVSHERAFRLLQQSSLGGWFYGIGLRQHGPHGKRFVHVDDLQPPAHPRPRVWTYNVE